MKAYKTAEGIIIERQGNCFRSAHTDWDVFVNQANLHQALHNEAAQGNPVGGLDWLAAQTVLAPIGSQEVWAAGVTYLRSKMARMEESKDSGGDTFYDMVYEAERPELFFKATAYRTVGTGGLVNIRKDSTWDVPEPELTLFVNAAGQIAGYTIGNDMSSRSIEGENPLYLPQAKMYDRCAGLGPCLYVPSEPIPPDTKIALQIKRDGQTVFEGDTLISQMKRTHNELVGFLLRECTFPPGVFLMTGTCVVPGNDFTLQSGDEIRISIDHIGTLINHVA